MTQKEFLEIFKLLDFNYNKETKPEIVRLWYDEFKDVKKDIFEKAIIQTIRYDNIFPTMNAVSERVIDFSRRVF